MEHFVNSYIQVLRSLFHRSELLVRVDDYELTGSGRSILGIFDEKEGYPSHTYRVSPDEP